MNRTKEFLLVILESGKYSYESLFSKLDLFFLLDRVSEEEYVELSDKIKEKYNRVGEGAEDELEA